MVCDGSEKLEVTWKRGRDVREGNELNRAFEKKHKEIAAEASDELIYGFDEIRF